MRILFVYSVSQSVTAEKPLTGNDQLQFGISYISAILKAQGHFTHLIILDKTLKDKNKRLLAKAINTFKPGIIAFTAVYSESEFIVAISSWIKSQFPQLFQILGGVHVTLNPSDHLLQTFDALCIGEGEYPMAELAGMLDKGEKPSGIKNLWIKQGNHIEKNVTRKFIDPDQLPFPDRDLWKNFIVFPGSAPVILLGRGCPFQCTYCSNHTLRTIAEGKYVRFRNPAEIVAEVQIIANQGFKEIYFEIETLGVDIQWLETLCHALHVFNQERTLKISFGSNLRLYPGIDLEKIFTLLSMAGFSSISIGLESGSDKVRKEILRRNYTNELVVRASQLARSKGIRLGLYNLIGLPGETFENFCETLAVNQQVQPDWHATSIYFPYPGTDLYERAKKMNVLPEKLTTKRERQFAVMDLPGFSKKQIQKCFDRFHYDVYRKNPEKKWIKLAVYYLQIYTGHDFLSRLKTSFIRWSVRTGMLKITSRPGFITIFQKS